MAKELNGIKEDIANIKNLISGQYSSFWAKFLLVNSVFISYPTIVALLNQLTGLKILPSCLIAIPIYFGLMFGLLCIVLYNSNKKLQQKLKTSNIDSNTELGRLCSLDAKCYGFQRKSHEVTAKIEKDGSASSLNKTCLLALAKSITSIEIHTSTPHTPEGTPGQIEVTATPKRGKKTLIKPMMKSSSRNAAVFELNFIPALEINEEEDYEYEANVLKESFAMDVEELQKRNMEFEFMSFSMSYPTEEFRAELTFPKEFHPQKTGYDVWMGNGKVRHLDEFIRIHQNDYFRSDFRGKELYLELDIKYPIHGLVYVLTWIPPIKEK